MVGGSWNFRSGKNERNFDAAYGTADQRAVGQPRDGLTAKHGDTLRKNVAFFQTAAAVVPGRHRFCRVSAGNGEGFGPEWRPARGFERASAAGVCLAPTG